MHAIQKRLSTSLGLSVFDNHNITYKHFEIKVLTQTDLPTITDRVGGLFYVDFLRGRLHFLLSLFI